MPWREVLFLVTFVALLWNGVTLTIILWKLRTRVNIRIDPLKDLPLRNLRIELSEVSERDDEEAIQAWEAGRQRDRA